MSATAASVPVMGLCSVTFRGLDVDSVARLAAESGIGAIEWGADVHVPPGDAAAVTRAAGASGDLMSVSYGSYLLADGGPVDRATIERVLDTAVRLGATNVRVWTPFGVDAASRRIGAVADQLRAVAELAAERSLTIGVEFHGGTATATAAGASALVDSVGAANLFTYWQPPYWLTGRGVGDDVHDIRVLAHRVSHLHVYEWTHGATPRRLALAAGAARWRAVLRALGPSPAAATPRVAWLEFVPGDDPGALATEAATLAGWLRELRELPHPAPNSKVGT